MYWIKFLNEMFEANCYTDNGRVRVAYYDSMRIVVVKVCNKYEIIEVDEYNDFGLMYKILEVIHTMYETA